MLHRTIISCSGTPSYSGLMTPHGTEVLSNSHCSSLKIILISLPQFGLCHGCSIQIFMQMGVYAWTSSKTSGALYMMLLLYLPPSSHCSATLIRILLQTRKQLGCTAKASVSTTEECVMLLSKAGLLTSSLLVVIFATLLLLSKTSPLSNNSFHLSFPFMSFVFSKL